MTETMDAGYCSNCGTKTCSSVGLCSREDCYSLQRRAHYISKKYKPVVKPVLLNFCNYIHRNGSVCTAPCENERCKKHTGLTELKKCISCDLFTSRKSGMCVKCANG